MQVKGQPADVNIDMQLNLSLFLKCFTSRYFPD